MYICKNCGQTYPTQMNFCSQCGSNAIEPQVAAPAAEQNFFSQGNSLGGGSMGYSNPAPSEPAYSAPAYSNPTPAYSEPAYSNPAPAYSEPAYSAPTYSEPAYSNPTYSAPSYSAPSSSKGPAIAGMICGLIAALFGLYTFIGALIMADSHADEGTFVYVLIMSIFQLPLTIIGMIQSFKARALKGMSIVGIISSIASAAMWFIAFIVGLSEL